MAGLTIATGRAERLACYALAIRNEMLEFPIDRRIPSPASKNLRIYVFCDANVAHAVAGDISFDNSREPHSNHSLRGTTRIFSRVKTRG
tara:strand:- start:36 stop:302 length:267 start_codon:yes stop_codon:yes gene_type:complete